MSTGGLSYEEVLNRLSAVFRTYGYDAATLKKLSEATGLGRSSLYHHFPNGKPDMAAAVLKRAHDHLHQNVIAVLHGDGAPRARAKRAAQVLFDYYDGGKTWCLIELFALGDAVDLFGPLVRETLSALLDGFAQVAKDAGAPPHEADRRAEEAAMAVHGALVMSRAQGRPDVFVRTIRSLPDRLLGPGETGAIPS